SCQQGSVKIDPARGLRSRAAAATRYGAGRRLAGPALFSTGVAESMKPGIRLKSAVCDTEVMVIRGSGVVVECGGQPMVEQRPETPAALDPAFAEGTRIGKRYVNAEGTVELLCVKAGQGTLAIGGQPLEIKDAKPLPSSD